MVHFGFLAFIAAERVLCEYMCITFWFSDLSYIAFELHEHVWRRLLCSIYSSGVSVIEILCMTRHYMLWLFIFLFHSFTIRRHQWYLSYLVYTSHNWTSHLHYKSWKRIKRARFFVESCIGFIVEADEHTKPTQYVTLHLLAPFWKIFSIQKSCHLYFFFSICFWPILSYIISVLKYSNVIIKPVTNTREYANIFNMGVPSTVFRVFLIKTYFCRIVEWPHKNEFSSIARNKVHIP